MCCGKKNVEGATFLHNRKGILTIDPDLNRAWCEYRSAFSLPNQYFRRSSHYPHAAQTSKVRPQSRLSWSRLYLERSFQLLRPGGRCGLVLDPFWDQDSNASLCAWLQARSRIEGLLDVGNAGELWPGLPNRAALCLLWLQAAGTTPTPPLPGLQSGLPGANVIYPGETAAEPGRPGPVDGVNPENYPTPHRPERPYAPATSGCECGPRPVLA